MKKYRVGILGATGMVGQRLVQLLNGHPWFEVSVVAASQHSAGKTYDQAIQGRWKLTETVPIQAGRLPVMAVEKDMAAISQKCDFVFCALDMKKEQIIKIEEAYAALGVPVVSNNSAHRWTEDVPMIIPEINPDHLALIDIQRQNRGWKNGFIVVKPNCSIQSYVAVISALREFGPQRARVVSLQSISGSGKTFQEWPEMIDNVIPYIDGEEEKSEREPMKIWAKMRQKTLVLSKRPQISATCLRIPTTNGHLASVAISFSSKPTKQQIIDAVENFPNPIADLNLPSAPKKFLQYLSNNDLPQIKLNREFEGGMGVSMGRLQPDKDFDYSFVALAHNTIRGAAGGAILTAELLAKRGYLRKSH